MTALYLGVVVLPLVVLVWNLGPGGSFRRDALRDPTSIPASEPLPVALPRRRMRDVPGAFVAGFRAAWARSTASAGATTPATFEIAPDLPRSPSSPGWVPAQGYSARPRA